MYNILSIGRASVFVMPCFRAHICPWMEGRKEGRKERLHKTAGTKATKVLCLQILMILREIYVYISLHKAHPLV
jgi:hypothetical protein